MENKSLEKAQPQMALTFTETQVALIKQQIAPTASDDELKLFLYQAQRTGLDPLKRQIYCIRIGGKMSIQTSIDGFRVIAERSGSYAGQSEPIFEEVNGKIVKCKISVFRFAPNGQRYEASVGVAYMSEYAQGSTMWTKMPHTMISKCAEALALRKAYPQDLSGLYTQDEMAQAEPNANQEFNAKTESLPTKAKVVTPTAAKKEEEAVIIDDNFIKGQIQLELKKYHDNPTQIILKKDDFFSIAARYDASKEFVDGLEKRLTDYANNLIAKQKNNEPAN